MAVCLAPARAGLHRLGDPSGRMAIPCSRMRGATPRIPMRPSSWRSLLLHAQDYTDARGGFRGKQVLVPARAGLHRRSGAAWPRPPPCSRMCGATPQLWRPWPLCEALLPHARGYIALLHGVRHLALLAPAHAGLDRTPGYATILAMTSSRTRGTAPALEPDFTKAQALLPHARGYPPIDRAAVDHEALALARARLHRSVTGTA